MDKPLFNYLPYPAADKRYEKITGKPIHEVMEERVLKPLGMAHSGFVWKASFMENYALPHDEEGKPEQKYWPGQANMAYSLHTTAEDYARFLLARLTPTGLKQSSAEHTKHLIFWASIGRKHGRSKQKKSYFPFHPDAIGHFGQE